MKSGDFPESNVFHFPDDVEIDRVTVQMEKVSLPKEMAGYRNVVYLERADDDVALNSFRSFRFPANTVLVVKEEPC